MDGDNIFEKLVIETLGEEGLSQAKAGQYDYFLEVSGRPVQLQYLPRRGEVVLSTPVFIGNSEGSDLYDELIAEFNAYHLLRGGYCLLIDDKTNSLYVAQSKPIESLSVQKLTEALGDFVARASSCSVWYMDELFDYGEGEGQKSLTSFVM